MSAEDNDETNALIARLLAEDNPYEEDRYEGQDDEDDEDYGRPAKRRKPRGGKASGNQAQKAAKPSGKIAAGGAASAVTPPEASGHAAADQENRSTADAASAVYSETGRKRRKDTGAVRTAARGWSEDEERLFQEGLARHGRDWAACAAHIGSRDAKSVTSHCQKFLVRLAIDGKPLPPKMAESGTGYTLSGKLLDPTSASARAYGMKSAVLARLHAENSPSLVGMTPLAVGPDGGLLALPPPAVELRPDAQPKGRSRQDAKAPQEEAELDPLAPVEPTAYALARPRREAAGARSAVGGTSESLELVRCRDFVGPPGSGAPLAQPFSLEVRAQAAITMDFHAHLSGVEIIGLLGGSWDPTSRRLSVIEAFPCRSAQGTESRTSVELDPEHEVQTRALMHDKGLVSVGWYHSHPVFETRPSQKDCENQRNYQALFRTAGSKDEPFVAAIVGPYDVALPDLKSAVSWFVVQSRGNELVPFNLRYSITDRVVPHEEAAIQLRRLAARTRNDAGQVDLGQQWRGFQRLNSNQPEGRPISRLGKMVGALRAHLPSGDAEAAAVKTWLNCLTDCLALVQEGEYGNGSL